MPTSIVWLLGLTFLFAIVPPVVGQYHDYYDYDYYGGATAEEQPVTEIGHVHGEQDPTMDLYYDYYNDVPDFTRPAPEEMTQVQAVVFGGTKVDAGRFDYVVSIFKLGQHICGGTLIEPDVVLTAAQCVSNRRSARFPTTVYIKRADLSEVANDEQVFAVLQTVVHPEYNPETRDNDVALLKLSRSSDATLANYFINAELSEGTPLTVLGYGVTSQGSRRSNSLREGTVAFESAEGCAAVYGHRITGSMVCASSPNAQDACQGDSGGPLVQESAAGDILVGIVSWGDGCAEPGKPGVYASMESVRTWVEDTLVALGSA
jgi:secreted trypsin-like serine protease